jgi:hypothetical protein
MCIRGSLDPDGPVVCWVHGIPGIGKSALLHTLVARSRAGDARVVPVDGRNVEPSESGFLHHLGRRLDAGADTIDAVTARLHEPGRRTVVVVDSYERLRLLDFWFRGTFVPALPRDARLVVASRYPPPSRWLTRPGWRELVRPVRLGPLSDEAARDLLERMGVAEELRDRILDFARGHPLALQLAAATARRSGEPPYGKVGISEVVQELSRHFLEGVEDDGTREALVAASAVRRTTVTLLGAIFPDRDARELHDRLASLPFVYSGPDGLVVHDAVGEAIAAATRAHDPERYRRYRRSAWQLLRSEVREAGRSELWRYTADMLYLIENPICREAFFPSGAQELSVEPADGEDRDDVIEIARRHEGPEAVDLLRYWWRVRSHRFRVVVAPDGDVVGFYFMLPADEARAAPQDPVVEAWLDHLSDGGPDPGDTLFIRRWLAREDGEAPSAVQAASWLDIKGTYMEMRPDLRRVYLTVRELGPYAEACSELGFEHLPDLDRAVDGDIYATACLDMGPASVDGLFRELAAAELGITAEEAGLLDHASRELVVGDRRVDLSAREFDLLSLLEQRMGEAVSREELRRTVWQDVDVASNVVDSVVYSLRQKMGDDAERLETVRGFGYRLKRD